MGCSSEMNEPLGLWHHLYPYVLDVRHSHIHIHSALEHLPPSAIYRIGWYLRWALNLADVHFILGNNISRLPHWVTSELYISFCDDFRNFDLECRPRIDGSSRWKLHWISWSRGWGKRIGTHILKSPKSKWPLSKGYSDNYSCFL